MPHAYGACRNTRPLRQHPCFAAARLPLAESVLQPGYIPGDPREVTDSPADGGESPRFAHAAPERGRVTVNSAYRVPFSGTGYNIH